ncbi:MAG: dnaE [Ignavibacteria bacterium]|nr:dnaE [Ignavibacteria bacterium]
MQEFIHLHNHTHYSLLDAATTPDELVKAALEDGQRAIALTDHGVMFGCFEFYKKAQKAGIKPILGFEAYIASGSRFEKISGKMQNKGMRNYYHLVLLAKDKTGYKNLLKLTSLAHTEGFYYKPRIDRELLEKYHEGIIATSACIGGVINPFILNDDIDGARATAQYYKDLFGEDFYVEIQSHNLEADEKILKYAPQIAKELSIPLIGTNDIHYLKHEHAVAHNVLLMIRDTNASNSGQADIFKLRYGTPEMFFKTQEEMFELFKDYPEAVANTSIIADKCNVNFDGSVYMPEFKIPKDTSATNLNDYLTELTNKGLKEKFDTITDEISQRVDYELSVIIKMNYSGYFLIVADFIMAAKKLGVSVGPGRGSAAGSLVAYALGITNIDPLPYDLLFERFLNPDRVSMPDIDIDFSDDKRDKVISYVKDTYGETSVSQIITFGTLSTRAALTDIGRVLGVPLTDIKNITAKIPIIRGKVTPLADAMELPDLKWIKDSEDQKIKQLIEYSLILEGKIRNASTHAAGVVIAPGDITDFVPIYQPSKQKNQSVETATQYTMKDLEDAGLLKMDFLGLRTLSIIDNTLDMIEKNHGIRIDIDKIDFTDAETYKQLSDGNSLAVFQFESTGMQDYLKRLKPHTLEELTAMNALYRPGPMDNIPEFIDRKYGRKPIEYLHPLMQKSLEKTYGIIVYQEQVMQLVRDIAGFSLSQADILRRAMGKKDKKIMDEQKSVFFEGAAKKSISKKLASEIFELIYKFADYGFNKSHSLAYSYLAFQTAWLKTHYPAEFLAANMTAELNDQNKIVALIDEAGKFDIQVLPPNINRSRAAFTVADNKIFFGLAAIKNVGISAVDSIVVARNEKPFSTFFDFVSRVDIRLINKRTLEALVCSGAFDYLNAGGRASLYAAIEPGLEYAKAIQEKHQAGMDSLFGGEATAATVEPSIPDIPEWTEKERLDKEKEVLNFYVTGNPLDKYHPHIHSFSTLKLGDIESSIIGGVVRICGLINSVQIRTDKRGNTYAIAAIEDFSGKAECFFWSDSYVKAAPYVQNGAIVMCMGRSEMRDDNLKIYVDEILPIEQAIQRFAKGYQINIDLDSCDAAKINVFYSAICGNNGSETRVNFNVSNKRTDYYQQYCLSGVRIKLDNATTSKLMELFGAKNIYFLL